MVMAVKRFVVQDEEGNVVPGATVTVRQETGGLPLAAIYEDRDGTTPKLNPFNVGSDGVAEWFAPGGAYRVQVTADGLSAEMSYVAVGTKQEEDSEPPVVFPEPLTPIPPVVKEFTSSGTYTPTEGMTYCRIRVQAPGGGGGGGDGDFVSGGGGGGGEYAEGFFTADDIGAGQTVTIGSVGSGGSTTGGDGGAGGTTSVGSLISCVGGGGGQGTGSNSTNDTPTNGGAGGEGGSGGHIRIPGKKGYSPVVSWNGDFHFLCAIGFGGDSFMGRGFVLDNGGPFNQVAVTGSAGGAYGGGGSGGFAISTSGRAGGAGGPGKVIIEEFFDLPGYPGEGA